MVSMIITQRTHSDCGICCIAMLAGATYEAVLAVAGDDYEHGVGLHQASPILQRLGIAYESIATVQLGEDWAGEFKSMLRGRRALVSVPSVNETGANHMLYWNMNRLIDPSPRVKQTRIDKIRPHRIVLVAQSKR